MATTTTTSCEIASVRARGARGFSLTELMISIGILAIGLAMVATLFPAALEINRRSTREILGALICENGIAVAKMRFASGAVAAPKDEEELAILADDARDAQGDLLHNEYLTQEMCRFPAGELISEYGVVVMYRHIDTAKRRAYDPDVYDRYRLAEETPEVEEGHQLVVVSYNRLSDPGPNPDDPYENTPVIVQQSSWNPPEYKPPVTRVDGYSPTGSLTGPFRIDSPLIDRRTGEFARITQAWLPGANFGRCVLARRMSFTAVNNQLSFLSIVEEGQDRYSPAMTTMVTRLGLDWR